MSQTPPKPPGTPTVTPPRPQIPGISPELRSLYLDLDAAKKDYNDAMKDWLEKGDEETDKIQELVNARGSAEKTRIQKELDVIEGEVKDLKIEMDLREQDVKDIDAEIDDYKRNNPESDRRNNNNDSMQSPFDAGMQKFGSESAPASSAGHNEPTKKYNVPGQTLPGYQAPETSPNSLLLNSGGNPSTTPPVPKKSTSGYDDDFRAAAQVLYPGNSFNELPPLVRRDRQPLTQPERMYPVTGYDEDIYEPWPDDVIETAIKRYPDFRKKKTVAQRLENMASGGINAPLQTTDPFEQPQDNGIYSGPNQRKNRWEFD